MNPETFLTQKVTVPLNSIFLDIPLLSQKILDDGAASTKSSRLTMNPRRTSPLDSSMKNLEMTSFSTEIIKNFDHPSTLRVEKYT